MPGNFRTPSPSAPQKGAFYKEGEYWTVGVGGTTVRLKDARGLAYLSYLLRHPATEFHVLDLVGGIAGGSEDEVERAADSIRGDYELEKAGIHVARLGDAGEALDDQAKSAYRRRLPELREELEEAKAAGKVERAEQLEEEIDALTRELSRAVGLGGRDRRTASASERARQTVTKTIRGVLERVAQSDAGIGNIFARSIKTGTFCRYQPDPDLPIAWEFTATPAESAMSSPAPPSVPDDKERPSPAILNGVSFATAQRTPIVGREDESAAIRSAIGRAQAGRGSVIVLAGGPGVGKTRLAIEMAEYAARNGFACFLGRCYERDDPLPYLPFVQIIETMLAQWPDQFSRIVGDNAPELAQLAPRLRRVFPNLPEATELPPPQKRHYLFQSVAEALQRAAGTRPQLLILDDLHWADESTLALLNHLANRLAQYPLVIIGTCREEYSEHPALARTIEELIRLGVRPLKLSGLSKDSVAKMLEQMSERKVPESLVNTILAETNGNPFFVEEVYRHLTEEGRIFDSAGTFLTDLKIDEIDVPANVRLCIIRRLSRFSEDEMRVLSAAAVIGRSFSFQLLAAISEADVDELFAVIEKAQQMAIIVPSAEGPEKPFTFAHELLRQTLLAEISIARRQHLHAMAAQAIESQSLTSNKECAGEIADHLLRAGSFADRQTVIRWLIEAGNAALEASAFEEAYANLKAAVSRIEPQDSPTRAEILYKVGRAEHGLGRWQQAYENWDQALRIFIALNDEDGAARTCLQLAEVSSWSSNRRAVLTKIESFLARTTTPSAHRALLLSILALEKLDEGGIDAAAEAFATSLAIAERLPDRGIEGAVLADRAEFNFICLRLGQALDDSLRSAELINVTATRPWVRAQQLLSEVLSLMHLGRAREAYALSQELERFAHRIGQIPVTFLSRAVLAWIDFWNQPNLDQLEDAMRRDFDSRVGGGPAFFVSALSPELASSVKFLRGRWDDALRFAETASSPERLRHIQGINTALRLRAKAYSGDRTGALQILEETSELGARAGKTNSYGWWALLITAIEGLYVLGDGERAAMLYPLARALIDTGTICHAMVSRFPQTVAGIAAAAAHNWAAAEGHFQIANQQAESFPNVLEQADIKRFHAMMLIDRAADGDREGARALLNDALQTYQRIGMPGHVGLTQALLDKTR